MVAHTADEYGILSAIDTLVGHEMPHLAALLAP
jgi:hypothetical protein